MHEGRSITGSSGRVVAAIAVCAAFVAVLLASPPAGAAAKPLRTGFTDSAVYSGTGAVRARWQQRTRALSTNIVRIDVGWAVPPNTPRPASFDARDPGDPYYNFTRADLAIRSAAKRGLKVLALFTGAPRWAEGPGRPADASPGSWLPDPAALRDYGFALARRYSGSYPDPLRPGQTLPAVEAFQVWNEPNLPSFLSPGWDGDRAVAPDHYRKMLNAFYDGAKAANGEALVVTAGTAPYGDPEPGGRIMPARFARELLCMRKTRRGLRSTTCPEPARFDVLAHHPYPTRSPQLPALNDDDVSVADMHKLRTILRAAERSGTALPRKRHRLWATEVSYDSGPPDPLGIDTARHAYFTAQVMRLLSAQDADTVFWFLIRDQAPIPSFARSIQSGMHYRNGRRKPAARAFRFPFSARGVGKRSVRIWGRSPRTGRVIIERRRDGRWRRVRTVRVDRHDVFEFTTSRGGRSVPVYRARIGKDRSHTSSYGKRPKRR